MSIFPNHNLYVNGEDSDTDREVVVRKMTECVAMFCNVREKKNIWQLQVEAHQE